MFSLPTFPTTIRLLPIVNVYTNEIATTSAHHPVILTATVDTSIIVSARQKKIAHLINIEPNAHCNRTPIFKTQGPYTFFVRQAMAYGLSPDSFQSQNLYLSAMLFAVAENKWEFDIFFQPDILYPANALTPQTISQWLANKTFGPILFHSDSEVELRPEKKF